MNICAPTECGITRPLARLPNAAFWPVHVHFPHRWNAAALWLVQLRLHTYGILCDDALCTCGVLRFDLCTLPLRPESVIGFVVLLLRPLAPFRPFAPCCTVLRRVAPWIPKNVLTKLAKRYAFRNLLGKMAQSNGRWNATFRLPVASRSSSQQKVTSAVIAGSIGQVGGRSAKGRTPHRGWAVLKHGWQSESADGPKNCFLEWLQWLQWSQLLDVVWCSAAIVVVVL